MLGGEDSSALHCAAGTLGKPKRRIFNFLTVIAELKSDREVLWDALGFCFQFPSVAVAGGTCLAVIVPFSQVGVRWE